MKREAELAQLRACTRGCLGIVGWKYKLSIGPWPQGPAGVLTTALIRTLYLSYLEVIQKLMDVFANRSSIRRNPCQMQFEKKWLLRCMRAIVTFSAISLGTHCTSSGAAEHCLLASSLVCKSRAIQINLYPQRYDMNISKWPVEVQGRHDELKG